jgi:inositol transport system ATP-binding protein
MPDPILQVSNLSKSFAGIKALDDVQLSLRAGEVHALMGENGAGKSTFMKILVGLLSPDTGKITFDGEELKNGGAYDTLRSGISMIHQEILIIPELTVAQNIFLGREKEITGSKTGWLDDRKMSARAAELLEKMAVDIPAEVKMKHLRVAEMQMIEIAKAISNNAKVIIMDEPTSAISDKEVATLFRLIREMKEQGVAIIYISHKMDEIFEIADRITVLRDGKFIATKDASELDQNLLISMMVGREIENMFPEIDTEKGVELLSVRNLSKKGSFADINFNVHAGEILGISGLMGAGRTEIARAIFGLDKLDSGEIFVNGNQVFIHAPDEAIRCGIGYVSEDRKGWGFIPEMSLKDNMTMGSLRKYQKTGFISHTSESLAASQMAADLKIKSVSLHQKVTYLSGGNQQKVVLGKVLMASPQIIILDEPTRGVDVGAKFEIYKLIGNLCSQGIAIIMISSELPEILGLSDRILVLAKGRRTAILNRQEATQELIMKHAVS